MFTGRPAPTAVRCYSSMNPQKLTDIYKNSQPQVRETQISKTSREQRCYIVLRAQCSLHKLLLAYILPHFTTPYFRMFLSVISFYRFYFLLCHFINPYRTNVENRVSS